MNETLSERMRRGENEFAATWGDSIQLSTTVSRVRRRRVVRAVTASATAVVLVGTGAAGAFAWWQSDSTDPADTAAPSATPTVPPSEAAAPVPVSIPERYGAEPEMVDGAPVLVAASQDVADNAINPRPGPDFVPGERRPLDQVLSQAAINSCTDERCGMAALPAVTGDVLKSGKLTAAIDEWGILNGGVDPRDQLDYVVVAGPDIGAYMAVDLSAWGKDEGLYESWAVTDLAVDDGGHRVAAVLQEYVSGGAGVDPSMVVLFDLDTGKSTVLAQGLDYASVEWDGAHWRVFGYGPEGTLGALVSSDGQSWTTEGMQVARGWWMKEDRGYTWLYGQTWASRWWVLDGQAYPTQPDAATSCGQPYAASASGGYVRVWCGDYGQMHHYQLTAGEGWAPLDPALESQAPPASTSFGALGDGYVLWRDSTPTFLKNGSETVLDTPNLEPMQGYLADGGLWMLGDHELGWLSPDLDYRKILDYSDTVSPTVYPYGERPAS